MTRQNIVNENGRPSALDAWAVALRDMEKVGKLPKDIARERRSQRRQSRRRKRRRY